MSKTYKLVARVVDQAEISEFALGEGETMDGRVMKEIAAAAKAGKLDRMATRVGLPAISIVEISEGENLTGGPNMTSVGLYAPDGSPIADRRYRVDPVKGGMFTAVAIEDEIETPIGVFTSDEVASAVGQFWRNGHLLLPA